MKFIEASKFGGPEVPTLVEAPPPTPQEATLLVEVRAAGVNYEDIMARSGLYPRFRRPLSLWALKLRDILSARQPRFTNSLKHAKPPAKLYSLRRSEERNHVLQHINLAAS